MTGRACHASGNSLYPKPCPAVIVALRARYCVLFGPNLCRAFTSFFASRIFTSPIFPKRGRNTENPVCDPNVASYAAMTWPWVVLDYFEQHGGLQHWSEVGYNLPAGWDET